MNRKKIVAKTSVLTLIAQIVTFLFSFINRKIIIDFIGVDYLGLNSVLSDVLSMLSISELGFQSAITYRLYKPLSDGDSNRVGQIMGLLKKVYIIIGGVILALGILCIPLLKYVITDISIDWNYIYVSYLILLLSSVMTYFIAYKRTLLYADQKQFMITMVDMSVGIVFGILKIVLVILFKNYILFLIVHLIQNIVSNIYLNIYVNKNYNQRFKQKPDPELRKDVITDTKNVFAGKIANYIYSSTDNLVISAIVSTSVVGYVGNYKTVISAINVLISNVMVPFKPMIGNYLVEQDQENSLNLFYNYGFIRYTCTLVLLLPALLLINMFITLWYGADYLLGWPIAILMICDVYIATVHGPTGEFIDSLGYFKFAKRVSIIGAFLNISFSIVGAFAIGINGVFGATVISQTAMWIGRSYVVFKYYFKDRKEYLKYWIIQGLYLINFVALSAVGLLFMNNILPSSIGAFLIEGIVIEVLVIIDLLLFFGRTKEFQYLIKAIGSLIKR